MKTKLLYFFILSAMLISCQKELSIENGSGGGGSTGGGGGTGGGGTGGTAGCKDCIYIPMCDGSWYTYNDTLVGTAQVVTDTLKYVKDTTISSLTFKKFNSVTSPNSTYTNCTNGVTRVIGYNAVGTGGSTVSVIDLTMLKANSPVNTTWTDIIVNPTGQQVQYIDTIKEKSVSRVVNGVTYPDVIHVAVTTGIDIPILGFFVTNITDYYYARSVGLIEAVISDPNTGIAIEHRTLKAYFVP